MLFLWGGFRVLSLGGLALFPSSSLYVGFPVRRDCFILLCCDIPVGGDLAVEVLIVGGRVHEIGYRVRLLLMAQRCGVKRFEALNTYVEGRQAVVVRAGGGDTEKLVETIREEKPEIAEIQRVTVRKYDGEIPSIMDYIHFLNTEQLSKGIDAMLKMLEKQDVMIGKQDVMIGKQDVMLQKQDELVGELRLLRSDFREFLGREMEYLRSEIAELKRAVRRIEEKVGLTV